MSPEELSPLSTFYVCKSCTGELRKIDVALAHAVRINCAHAVESALLCGANPQAVGVPQHPIVMAVNKTNRDCPFQRNMRRDLMATLLARLGRPFVNRCIALAHLPVLILLEIDDMIGDNREPTTYHYRWKAAARIKHLFCKQ